MAKPAVPIFFYRNGHDEGGQKIFGNSLYPGRFLRTGQLSRPGFMCRRQESLNRNEIFSCSFTLSASAWRKAAFPMWNLWTFFLMAVRWGVYHSNAVSFLLVFPVEDKLSRGFPPVCKICRTFFILLPCKPYVCFVWQYKNLCRPSAQSLWKFNSAENLCWQVRYDKKIPDFTCWFSLLQIVSVKASVKGLFYSLSVGEIFLMWGKSCGSNVQIDGVYHVIIYDLIA